MRDPGLPLSDCNLPGSPALRINQADSRKTSAMTTKTLREVMTSSTIRPPDPAQEIRTNLEFDRLAAENPRLRGYLDHHLPFYRQLLALA